MTPKDKAKELVDKMEKDFQYFASREVAKQHALIAVDEIIQAMDNVMLPNPFKQYWNKVKQEIEAL
jgi:hypothetical protein